MKASVTDSACASDRSGRGRSSVTIGSGSHGPTYSSRVARADFRRSRHKPRDDRREVCLRRSEVVGPRRRKPQPGILQHVLGVGGAAEHAVGDAKQRRAVRLEEIELGHDAQAARRTRLRKPVADVRIRRPPAQLGARLLVRQRQPASRSSCAMYGASRRSNHDGIAIGLGAPAASATAPTISLKLTGSSSTMS